MKGLFGRQRETHALRKFRNAWVHVKDPWDDQAVQGDFDVGNRALFGEAVRALHTMREVLYDNQWV